MVDPRTLTFAKHECGHVVMALHHGIPFSVVDIIGEGRSAGAVQPLPHVSSAREYVQFCMGGLAGERVSWKNPGSIPTWVLLSGAAQDYRQARRKLEGVPIPEDEIPLKRPRQSPQDAFISMAYIDAWEWVSKHAKLVKMGHIPLEDEGSDIADLIDNLVGIHDEFTPEQKTVVMTELLRIIEQGTVYVPTVETSTLEPEQAPDTFQASPVAAIVIEQTVELGDVLPPFPEDCMYGWCGERAKEMEFVSGACISSYVGCSFSGDTKSQRRHSWQSIRGKSGTLWFV